MCGIVLYFKYIDLEGKTIFVKSVCWNVTMRMLIYLIKKYCNHLKRNVSFLHLNIIFTSYNVSPFNISYFVIN